MQKHPGKNNAKMVDVLTLLQAGIDPKTGLPTRLLNSPLSGEALCNSVEQMISLKDERQAINRYTWYNLPNINSELMERMLYYRSGVAAFYFSDEWLILPYALNGSIDAWGRYTGITPLPFNGSTQVETKGGKLVPFVRGLKRKPIYEILDHEATEIERKTMCVLLSDSAKAISQTNIPRSETNKALVRAEAECIGFMRTNLIANSGIRGMKVGNENEYNNVEAAGESSHAAAISGNIFVPIVGDLDFQDITGSSAAQASEFMMAMQSLDNFRLASYGLSNGGVFEKNGTMLESEHNRGEENTELLLVDGLRQRQHWCNVFNSLSGLGTWCEISDTPKQDEEEENDKGTSFGEYNDGKEGGSNNGNSAE